MGEKHFCGCCGNEIRPRAGAPDPMWCNRCLTNVDHLGPAGPPPWERTYLAVHGEGCPFQVGRKSMNLHTGKE